MRQPTVSGANELSERSESTSGSRRSLTSIWNPDSTEFFATNPSNFQYIKSTFIKSLTNYKEDGKGSENPQKVRLQVSSKGPQRRKPSNQNRRLSNFALSTDRGYGMDDRP